ncbi:MAG: sigma-54-dependent transcriptional regulator [Phycisphaerae bacterium]
MAQVLIVEDETILAKNLQAKLKAHGHRVTVVHSGEEAVKVFSRIVPEVVLLDVRLPGIDGITLLPSLGKESPSTNFVIMTAHGNERVAVDAMKAGAFEYLTKPIDLDELLLVVDRAVDRQQLADNLTYLRSKEERKSGLDRIIAESMATRNLKETIRRLTRTDVLRLSDPPSVLITGETGTGKDLVARAIHYEGPRCKKPFIHVNCTALPATLFESELFGHVCGAFTSASKAKRGLFEVAQGGSIFLDEIGHLDPDVQAKLLLAIEQREIRPVGATDTRPINVHVIAATNRNLNEAVASGEFRRDLYHRLLVIEIRLAPLRDRREDIMVLAEHFLARHCRRFGVDPRTFEEDAIDCLQSYRWPGNVRELSHRIESAILQSEGPTVDPADLHLDDVEESDVDGRFRIDLPEGNGLTMDFANGGPTLEEAELAILRSAYEYWGRNLSRAARSLGLSREALRYRLNKAPQAARSRS